MTDYPIARELLNVELARLLSNHFDDQPNARCQDCRRAYAMALELRALHELRKGGSRV